MNTRLTLDAVGIESPLARLIDPDVVFTMRRSDAWMIYEALMEMNYWKKEKYPSAVELAETIKNALLPAVDA